MMMQGNAKYKQFIATLDKKGFFKNLTKGSPGNSLSAHANLLDIE